MKLSTLAVCLFCFSLLAAVGAPSPDEKSVVTGAKIVNRPAGMDDWEVGDIEATFADGKTEVIAKDGTCGRPLVSKSGEVGWSVWKDRTKDRDRHSEELLKVRLRDGSIKTFKPNALFIMAWGYADDDRAVVMESMQHHGSSFYIKYDLKTGKELGRVDEYVPYDQLPKWAQPFAEKDS